MLRRRSDAPADQSGPLRALIVDDHEGYRGYIASVVQRFGFQVRECGDGAEALQALHDEPHFHLLVVDCEMPRMSGLALIGAVRAQEQYADAYAVMLTAREDRETKLAALRLGFDDFMHKSASDEEITAKVAAARRIVVRQQKRDEAVRELYGLATRDELTGLFNRRFFFAEAERMLTYGTVVNLVFFDLDEFKVINDTLGHLAGDRILRDIGSLFLRRTRHEDLIARYGGDEFVMLIPTLSPEEVEVLSDRIAVEIGAAQWTFGTEILAVGVTTGMACSSLLERPSVAQLLSAGDRDLYKNKWIRKNPDEDPSLYEYDTGRDAHVVELLLTEGTAKKKAE